MEVVTYATIGVYRPGTPSKGEPDFWIPGDVARRLVRSGDAFRINRNKAIRLVKTIRAGSGECGPVADAVRRLHTGQETAPRAMA